MSKRAARLAAFIAALVLPYTARAESFNAGVVMEKMSANERAPYIQGVIEGLAFARYQRDNQHVEGDAKVVTGMKCIYNWFYEKPSTLDVIYVAFKKYPDYTPAAIISSLIKQSCPE